MEQAAASRFFHTILPAGALNTGTVNFHDRKKGEQMAGIFTRKELAKILADEPVEYKELLSNYLQKNLFILYFNCFFQKYN